MLPRPTRTSRKPWRPRDRRADINQDLTAQFVGSASRRRRGAKSTRPRGALVSAMRRGDAGESPQDRAVPQRSHRLAATTREADAVGQERTQQDASPEVAPGTAVDLRRSGCLSEYPRRAPRRCRDPPRGDVVIRRLKPMRARVRTRPDRGLVRTPSSQVTTQGGADIGRTASLGAAVALLVGGLATLASQPPPTTGYAAKKME